MLAKANCQTHFDCRMFHTKGTASPHCTVGGQHHSRGGGGGSSWATAAGPFRARTTGRTVSPQGRANERPPRGGWGGGWGEGTPSSGFYACEGWMTSPAVVFVGAESM